MICVLLLLLTLNLVFVSANKEADNHVNDHIKAVDYRHIVRQPDFEDANIDESEIPPLC